MSDFGLTPEEMQLFFEEANEQLETMEEVLLSLERSPNDPALIQELFRAAHTLKGGAATVGFDDVARLTHAMETLLDAVRQGETQLTVDKTDRLLTGLDALRKLLAAAEETGQPASESSVDVDLDGLIQELEHGSRSDQTGGARSGRVYRWTIKVDPGTPLASVRLYQAIMTLEEMGNILQTEPSLEEIEDESKDIDNVSVLYSTDTDVDAIKAAIEQVPDMASIDWAIVDEQSVPSPSAVSASPTSGDHPHIGITDARGDDTAATERQSTRASVAVGMDRSVRVDVAVLDRLMNLVGELVIDRTRLTNLARAQMEKDDLQERLEQLSGHLSRITGELQDTIMRARMMPVQMLFRKFPRMVRDLSRQLGKPVVFQMEGEETELDRSVIEQLGDPLIHLLRNALDHGLETPEERKAAGKPVEGKLRLAAFHQESHIYVQVQDDGRGIDPNRIRRSAVAKGLISEEQAERLGPDESLELIFSPGFSTASEVSTVSGRGVGLDVVRRNIERVGGNVTIQSQVGKGTTFTIKLPLTLAILQALLVDIAGVTYAVPLASVVEAMLIGPSDIYPAHGWQMIRMRDQTIPLIDPSAIWGDMAKIGQPANGQPVVVIQAGSAPFALMVDRLLGEEEVVIKSLGALIGDVGGISGASILGDGSVALIVDASGLEKEVRQLA